MLLASCRELGGGSGHYATGSGDLQHAHGAADVDRRRQLASASKLSFTLRLAGGGRVSPSGTAKSGWLQVCDCVRLQARRGVGGSGGNPGMVRVVITVAA